MVLFLKNVERYEKTVVFPADMAGLGKNSLGDYGRIGVYWVKIDTNLPKRATGDIANAISLNRQGL